MANDFPSREVSNLVALFQRAHNKVIALARMDDQIAALVVQHERLQEEVKAVQAEINQEFARALKYNQAPSKLPGGVGAAEELPASNGEHTAPDEEDSEQAARPVARLT